MKTSLYALKVATLVLPFVAVAQTVPVPPIAPVTTFAGLINFIRVVAGWIFGILIALAVILILVAAFKYLTAGGDPEKVKSANHTLIYALIAVGVALLARALPILLETLVLGTATFTP